MATKPYEIIAAPFEVYVAPVGEAVPLIDATPAANWVKLGTSGDRNMSEDGVTVTHEQTIETDSFRTLGSTGPVKAVRTKEDLRISFTLLDLTLEEYARILNGNTVSETTPSAGVAGFKEVDLYRGLSVTEYALVIRGAGPYGDGWDMQYEIPKAVLTSSPTTVFQKGAPAGLEFEFIAIEDSDAAGASKRFGRLLAMNADQV
ncbi:MAG: hypothetical protein NOU37_09270 [Candidatus Brocadiales bacterium]|nr:hypothetical protein [Candidatus Bathyanammoxibius amoris]